MPSALPAARALMAWAGDLASFITRSRIVWRIGPGDRLQLQSHETARAFASPFFADETSGLEHMAEPFLGDDELAGAFGPHLP